MSEADVLPDLEDLKDKLTPRHLARMKAVFLENQSLFAKKKADMGRFNLVEHLIDLKADAVPHHEGARRMAP